MIEDIKDAITASLTEAFSNATVYTERVRQGLIRPCLFIENGKVSQKRLLGDRYLLTMPFEITFFPSQESLVSQKNFEMDKALEKLFFALRKVSSNDNCYNGSEIEATSDGEKLNFKVCYKAIVNHISDENKELMAQIKLIKGSE